MFSQHIFIIGYMGSGKSKIGKNLAKKLKMPFLDSDLYIEIQENKSISQIFEQAGETYFRQKERDFLENINTKLMRPTVISTGGGMSCTSENIALMNEIGLTIYFEHPVKQLLNRLLNSKKSRPLIADLNTEELENFIQANLQLRSEFYNQAKIIVNPSKQDINDIVELINNYKD